MGTDGVTFNEEIPYLKLHAIAGVVNVQRLFKIFSVFVCDFIYVHEPLNSREISVF